MSIETQGGEGIENFICIYSFHRMLDEFGAEIEHADTRLDATMKKMAKVLHLSDGKSIHSCSS